MAGTELLDQGASAASVTSARGLVRDAAAGARPTAARGGPDVGCPSGARQRSFSSRQRQLLRELLDDTPGAAHHLWSSPRKWPCGRWRGALCLL